MSYKDRRCPHCGGTTGLYTRYKYINVRSYYSFTGQREDESLDDAHIEGGNRMYCQTCDRHICKTKDYEKLFPREDTK